MTRFLLDTNTCVYLARNSSDYYLPVRTRLEKLAPSEEARVSILSYYEMQHSLLHKGSTQAKGELQVLLDTTRRTFPLHPLLEDGASIFAEVKEQYMANTGIKWNAASRHNIDFMLAGTAIAEGMILVSNDKIFESIQSFRGDLQLENWAK